MKIFSHLLLAIVLYGFLSCSARQETITTRIPSDVFNSLNSIPASEVLISFPKDSIILATVLRDSLLCILFKPENTFKNTLSIESINHRNQNLLTIPYGDGTGEMMLPLFSHQDSSILLYDLVLNKTALIRIEDLILNEIYEPEFYSTNIITQEIIPDYKKRRFIYLNQYSYNGKEPRFLYSDPRGNQHERKRSYYYFNVCIGKLVQHPHTHRIAYLGQSQPSLELMDEKGHLIRRIIFPREHQEVTDIRYGNITDYIFVAPVINCFTAATANDQFIAGAYETDDHKYYIS